ncbi:MAG: hypothetical protein ABIB71_01810 [Candidatus Woesearchaeota archaeon]
MGEIIRSENRGNGKVMFEILVDYSEAIELQGNAKNVHIFSEDVIGLESGVSLRGKNESTKYFLIPKQLRKGLKFNSSISCQKIDAKTKIFFVYVIDKQLGHI